MSAVVRLCSAVLLAMSLGSPTSRASPAQGDLQLTGVGVDFLTRGGRELEVRLSNGLAWTAPELPVGAGLQYAMRIAPTVESTADYVFLLGPHLDLFRVEDSGLRVRAAAGPAIRWGKDVTLGWEGEASAGIFLCFSGVLFSASYGVMHIADGWVERTSISGGLTW
ncbi:MAG: hypothetical protein Q8O67_21585 [Deltaproteobacteria bacterium]|nr:hypothetical protein [Deltaproteobacteria bacterium]